MARYKTPVLEKKLFFRLTIPMALSASFILLLLLATTSADIIPTTVIWLAVITGSFAISALWKKQMGGLCTLATASILLYMVIFGLSTFFATSGKFAMSEYSKLLVAFFAYILSMLFLTTRTAPREKRMNALLFAMSTVSAVVGFASISSGFGDVFAMMLSPITETFQYAGGVETGIRITSILGNPNVYGGFMGLGIFATLALLVSSTTANERNVSLFLLALNSIAFLLAFSMGATGAIACGFVLILVLLPKEKRGSMFASMLLILVLTLVGVSVAFPLLETSAGFISLLATLVCAGLAPILDHYIIAPILHYCDLNRRMVTGGLIGLVIMGVAFVFLAVTLTGPTDLNGGEMLRRSAYPTAGEYTLSVESSGPVSVTIESQDKQEAIIHSSTIVYTGIADEATFIIPEGSLVTYFNFSSDVPVTIDSATWSGSADAGELPLNYKLLPAFLSNRLQGLKANENVIQRTAFFEDGLDLFALHPLTGNGLGGFENGVKQVQDFYYETKYVHNHFIQSLCDAGIPGLLAFLSVLGTTGFALIKGRKNEKTAPVSAILLGALLFVIIHATAEVIFSDAYYLLFVFLFFALAAVQVAPSGDTKPVNSKPAVAVSATIVGLCAIFGTLWFFSAQGANVSQIQQSGFFASMEKAAKLDYYNKNDYLLSYVVMSNGESPDIVAQADIYAEYLSTVPSNTIGQYLVGYYLQRQEVVKAFDTALSSITYVKSDPDAWNKLFTTLDANTTTEVYQTDPESYQEGLTTLIDYLAQVQAIQLDTITLDSTSLAYLEKIEELASLDDTSVNETLNTLFDLNDVLMATDGQLPDVFNVTFKQMYATPETVRFEEDALAELILPIPADIPIMLFIYVECSNVDDIKVLDQMGTHLPPQPHEDGYIYNALVVNANIPVVTFSIDNAVTITAMTVTR